MEQGQNKVFTLPGIYSKAVIVQKLRSAPRRQLELSNASHDRHFHAVDGWEGCKQALPLFTAVAAKP